MQIAIVFYPHLTALDALGPYEVLRNIPGAEVRLVGHEVGPVATDGILVVGATHDFASTPRPDVVLVPGSSNGTGRAMTDPVLLEWLRRVHATTRLTTSVCSGALVLAAAGLLEGLPATSHWAALPFLARFGAEPRPSERIVRAGKVWTAAGVSAGIDLAFALTAELADQETAEVTQLVIEYDPQPPFDAGHMTKASERVRTRATREMTVASMSVPEALAIPRALASRWISMLTR